MSIRKTFEIKILEKRKDGGRIAINTISLDRDNDRVMPSGIDFTNYMKNPIVQWGHNYHDPWATIGRSNTLTQSPETVIADFTLRPAVNEFDPQNIILQLWNGDWVRTASIGFIPKQGDQNAEGGRDYTQSELLEWSIVPVPSNQDALRLAKSFGDAPEGERSVKLPCTQCGAETFFSWSLFLLAQAASAPLVCQRCVNAQSQATLIRALARGEDDGAAYPDKAWIRRLDVIGEGMGAQTVFACFHRYVIDVPIDAEMLELNDETGECEIVPDPDAGGQRAIKQVTFVPPIEYEDEDWGADATYSIGGSEKIMGDDAQSVKGGGDWEVTSLSDVLASIPALTGKAYRRLHAGFAMNRVTQRAVDRAKAIGTRLAKRGRVLSGKNEGKIRDARDKLNEVLAEVEQAPEVDSIDAPLIKGAIAPHTTPKADPDTSWDGPAVVASLPNERTVLRKVHAWVDEDADPDTKQAYKFPHHLADGRVVLRGVNNAKARLPQASIPDGDRAGVEAHLNHHQAQFEAAYTLSNVCDLCHESVAEDMLAWREKGRYYHGACYEVLQEARERAISLRTQTEDDKAEKAAAAAEERELVEALKDLPKLLKEALQL